MSPLISKMKTLFNIVLSDIDASMPIRVFNLNPCLECTKPEADKLSV